MADAAVGTVGGVGTGWSASPGDRVSVHSFGVHAGTVEAVGVEVTLQGRTRRIEDWRRVRLDDGRTWNGAPGLLAAA